MALVGDAGGKGVDHVGVGDVLLLRDVRHDEVVANEPDDEFAFLGGEAVAVAELLRVDGPALGMAAAAALGDVVENRRDVEQPGGVEVGDELAAERVFVRELALGKAAQVCAAPA